MITFNFDQSVGFPLDTDILTSIQKAYKLFGALGGLAGNFSIISGCTLVGSTVSNGAVYINGELFEFKGGVLQSNVIIVEERTTLEFEDNNEHDVIFNRYATFGTGTTQYPWEDFKRVFESKNIPQALADKEDKTVVTGLVERIAALEAMADRTLPIGIIAIWGKPIGDIPIGWQPYEPLKGRIPIGLDTAQVEFDTLLDYGGSKTHTNTIEEMAAHDHDIASDSHNAAGGGAEKTIGSDLVGFEKTEETGEGIPYSIMNPYRVVHFIEYIGIE